MTEENKVSVDIRAINEKIEKESAFVDLLMLEMNKVIVGQKHMVERLLIGLLGQGHILLEGVPGLSNKEGIVEISGWHLIEQSGKIMLTENFELAKKVALGEQLFDGELDVTEEEVKGPLYGNFNTNYGSYSNDVLMLLNDRLTESGIGKLWMAEKITLSGDPNRMNLRIVMKEKAKNSLGTFVDSMFEAIFSY